MQLNRITVMSWIVFQENSFIGKLADSFIKYSRRNLLVPFISIDRTATFLTRDNYRTTRQIREFWIWIGRRNKKTLTRN